MGFLSRVAHTLNARSTGAGHIHRGIMPGTPGHARYTGACQTHRGMQNARMTQWQWDGKVQREWAVLARLPHRFSRVWLFAPPWAVAHQAPLSMGFSRQTTGVDCHAIPQGIFPIQGSNPYLVPPLHWQAGTLPLVTPRKSCSGVTDIDCTELIKPNWVGDLWITEWALWGGEANPCPHEVQKLQPIICL